MKVLVLSKDEWAQVSDSAHQAVFGKTKPVSQDRYDYALLVVKDDTPVAYVTVRELDHETVYWQFGGGFPWAWKSILMSTSLKLLLSKQSELTKRVTCRVANRNVAMLRLALASGFLIFGTRTVKGECLLELGKEFSDDDEQDIREHAERETSSAATQNESEEKFVDGTGSTGGR